MKTKLAFFLTICFYLNTTKAQLRWLPLATAPKSWRLDDFYFMSPQKGWAISPCYNYLTPHHWGQIWTTSDGGNNWRILKDSSTTFYRSIAFADSLTGWVGNLADSSITPDSTPMYHTTDGGVTWNPITNVPNPKPKGICGISVVTDSVIYAYGRYYGPPVLLKTTNKGNTWTSTDMSPYASGLVDAWFFDKDTGFVTGCYGNYPSGQHKALILSTFDGGTTWQVRHQSTRPNEEVWKISFPTRNVGYASIEFQGDTLPNNIQTYYLKTTDGGITWTDVPFLPAGTWYDLEGIGFINDSVGWIGGDNCLPTYKTTNGGTTWDQDLSLGLDYDYMTCNSPQALAMNRFRRFGDTLMYGSGYTVCKLSKLVTPIPYFYASATIVCAGSSVTFADSTINTYITGWQWSFPGGTLASGSTLTDSMPVVIYNTPGTYAVTYTASNSAGSASITKTSYIHVLTVAQVNTAFFEGFETDSVPGAFWSVTSSASSNWMVTSTAVASGSKSVMINNMSNAPGDTSKLIGPTLNLAAIGSPILTFAMAYQQKITTNNDELQVQVSTDCGETWVSKWAHTGASLQPPSVSGQSSSPFVPIPSQFTTYTINLASVTSSTNAMFRWVFYAGASSVGNNIYLDNINIFNPTMAGITQFSNNSNGISIYPNPNNGLFIIEPNSNTKQTMQVYDVNGRLVLNQIINSKATIDASSLNEGVYNISIISNEGIVNKKLVIVR